jgi:hypothetical protein
MPIPPLTEHGFLPDGIHDCSLAEVEERFGGFQGSDRRMRLFAKLRQYVAEVRFAGLAIALIIDGSFVTNKPDPGDIDLILIVPEDHDFSLERRPFEYNPLSKHRVRQEHGFDLFTVREKSQEYKEFLSLFQQVRGQPTLRKGHLRIQL